MKIEVDRVVGHNIPPIVIEEYLDPNGANYVIRQGDVIIEFFDGYELNNLIKALQFFQRKDI